MCHLSDRPDESVWARTGVFVAFGSMTTDRAKPHGAKCHIAPLTQALFHPNIGVLAVPCSAHSDAAVHTHGRQDGVIGCNGPKRSAHG